MTIRSTRVAGFTLVELLAVSGILAIVIAIALPAVQAAREAARRVQCASNLKQIGISILTYDGTYACLPAGRVLSSDPRYNGPNPPCTSRLVDKSFLVLMLPFVESSPIYDAINQQLTIFGYENRTIFPAAIGIYACPSDPASGVARDADMSEFISNGLASPGEQLRAVFTSYSGSYGSFDVDALPRLPTCETPPRSSAQANGCINDTSPVTLSSVQDGLSDTVLVVEKATATFGELNSVNPALSSRLGWYFSGNWGDTLATAFYPPNMYRKVSIAAGTALSRSASSLHPGGVNTLRCDGSVSFVKDTIQSWAYDPVTGQPLGATKNPGGWWDNSPAPGVWQALNTRAGAELLSGDSY
jgi:prepilin-type N-terminal cleavage/methylation domain-containing protein/prepilin-type processing-associated H-X9-DG protein